MLNSIGSDLLKSVAKAGITKQVEAVRVCDLWAERVVSIFGPQVADKSQAVHFRNGVLTVAVLSAVLAQEFRFKEEELIAELNRGCKQKVRKIRFEI